MPLCIPLFIKKQGIDGASGQIFKIFCKISVAK
ncbi:hypothetical protein MHA_0512 [Mannheimia haemolytica PHL213]|nr:hypothetical protein MHA_0512 [Mannheimia haemolytica PHL213]